MQKTKLGISVGLLGALLYFSGLFSGYTITIVIAGYVLLAEDNAWLKRTSVKAIALLVGFSLVLEVIGLIPDVIGLINNVFNIFGGSFSIKVVSNIITFLHGTISFAKTIVFLILGLKAFNQGTVRIPVIDNLKISIWINCFTGIVLLYRYLRAFYIERKLRWQSFAENVVQYLMKKLVNVHIVIKCQQVRIRRLIINLLRINIQGRHLITTIFLQRSN